MDTKELLISIFENYFSQVYKKGYKINESSNKKMINNFFTLLGKNGYHSRSIGENFLNHFIVFQFDYWKEKEIKRIPTLNWFIGKKAIERYFLIDNWEQKNYFVSINTQHLTPLKLSSSNSEYENRQRSIYHNTNKGLLNCIENTSLYTKCLLCIKCTYKLKCKELLKVNYPLLYNKRLK